ncbi:MarR family winged helix-turn-helix transcriptional regulator [Microbacterium sp. GXF7504]
MTTVPGWTDGLPYALFRANQAVQRRLVDAIDGLDVTITQLGIAVHLDELGHMSGSDLARRFRITPQSASTALSALEARGWVTRVPHPFHGRVIWYEVTDAGRAGAQEGRRRIAVLQEQFAEQLGAESMRGAIEQLQAISTALDGAEPPATMWPA